MNKLYLICIFISNITCYSQIHCDNKVEKWRDGSIKSRLIKNCSEYYEYREDGTLKIHSFYEDTKLVFEEYATNGNIGKITTISNEGDTSFFDITKVFADSFTIEFENAIDKTYNYPNESLCLKYFSGLEHLDLKIITFDTHTNVSIEYIIKNCIVKYKRYSHNVLSLQIENNLKEDLNGTWTEFDKDGRVISNCELHDGKFNGAFTTYDIEGNVLNEQVYEKGVMRVESLIIDETGN